VPVDDWVRDDETLYRRTSHRARKKDGSVSSAAFGGDRDLVPSVNRADLCGNDPTAVLTPLRPESKCVVSLLTNSVRAISTTRLNVDVIPDPVKNDPVWPGNLAHALITADPPLTNENREAKNVARDFRRALARISTWEIAPSPET
jgi:hypothetical protein